jgi:hypothetical protein
MINVEDTDFRDMLFDYRVTQPGIMCVLGGPCCQSSKR